MNNKQCSLFIVFIGITVCSVLILVTLITENDMYKLGKIGITILILSAIIFIADILVVIGFLPKTWFFEEVKKEEHCFFLYDSSNNNEIVKEKFSDDCLIVLPTSTKKIESGIFSEYPNLKQIFFLNPDIEIGEGTFAGCFKLEEVDLPGHLKTIESYTFAMCKNLKKVVVPKSVSNIKERPFLNCNQELLLLFDYEEKDLAFLIKEYENWGLSETCKIKFRDWEKEKTIREYLAKK